MPEPSLEDLKAGDAFRDYLLDRKDAEVHGCPLWYGWAIMNAFLAGANYAREQQSKYGNNV